MTSRHKDAADSNVHQNFMTMTGSSCVDTNKDQDFSKSAESITG